MSNPGVITLVNASSKKGKFQRFVIEDNIGESIHLHIDNTRVDFTIEEFFEFSDLIRKSLLNLNFTGGYNLDSFDEHFLMKCSVYLPKLKSIEIEEAKLSNLKCVIHSIYRKDLNLIKLANISEIPAYKFLQGDTKEFLDYRQYNYFGTNNEKRLLKLIKSIKENGYPYLNKYILLFNGEEIIRDGQHRAAILAHLYGHDYKVKVMRLNFSDNSHKINIKKDNFKSFSMWFAKKVYRRLKSYIK
jgi:hypothetical protein